MKYLVVLIQLCQIISLAQGFMQTQSLKQRPLSSSPSTTEDSIPVYTPNTEAIQKATEILTRYDQLQVQYMKENPIGMGGGTAALQFLQTQITPEDREQMRQAVVTLVSEAHQQRARNSSEGRIMLGICAENVDEALLGLKTWVSRIWAGKIILEKRYVRLINLL